MPPPFKTPGVYVDEMRGSRPIEGVGTAVAAFVGLATKGPFNIPTLVTNLTQFTNKFGPIAEESYLGHAVFGFFLNGGNSCYVIRIGEDGAAPEARLELPSAADGTADSYRIMAKEPGAAGNEIMVEVADPDNGGQEDFTLIVRRGSQEERYDNVTSRTNNDNNIVTVLNQRSALVGMEEMGRMAAAKRRPATGIYTLSGGTVPAVPTVGQEDYVGDVEGRRGLGALEAIDEITMVCVPDLMAAYQKQALDLNGVKAVQEAMIGHCDRQKDRMAILDAPPGFSPQQVLEWRVEGAGHSSMYAALYYPWLNVMDPASGNIVSVPPCGHIAGIWSRNDGTRGVHKAPANEVVRGALNLDVTVTRGEQALLNPEGINVIRAFPGQGIRVWGARTLTKDKSWHYINVRRLFNYLEESIVENTQWVVFEPNDKDLWKRISRSVNAFLMGEWRNGALFGAVPEQAFYVKCDEENNPSESIEQGIVVIDVGVAAVKPAEFVWFRVAQVPAGANGNG